MMNANLQQALAHVLWLGGGTDTGKTTVAETITRRHGLQYYNFDRNEISHIERRKAAGDYSGRKFILDMTPDEMWVDAEPAEMAAGIITGWARRAEFAIADLLALPKAPLILAEGPGFFPEVVEPLIHNWHQALWFVPTPAFKRKIAIQRGKPSVRLQTRDPERATENIIGRDLLVAEHIRREAIRRGVRLVEIDGLMTIEDTIALVEQHFEPFLK